MVRYTNLARVLNCGIYASRLNLQHSTSESSENSASHHRLHDFVQSLRLEQRKLEPKNLAIGPSIELLEDEEWPIEAKKVPKSQQKLLLDIITRRIPAASMSDNRKSMMEDLHVEMKYIIDSIMIDDAVPTGVKDYLLHDCGFAKSWPRVANGWRLQKKGPKKGDGEWKMPDGSPYPPVKYIAQTTQALTDDIRGSVLPTLKNSIPLRVIPKDRPQTNAHEDADLNQPGHEQARKPQNTCCIIL